MVLGVDPGLSATGYGLIRCVGARHELVDYGCVTTRAGELGPRLVALADSLVSLLRKWHPDESAVEMLYWGRNVSSAMPVAHARGAVILVLSQMGLTVHEYQPADVKMRLTGNGGADKAQVQRVVAARLGLVTPPRPDHAADALAVALAHIQIRPWQLATGR